MPKLGEEELAEPIRPATTRNRMATRIQELARDFHRIDVGAALKSPLSSGKLGEARSTLVEMPGVGGLKPLM